MAVGGNMVRTTLARLGAQRGLAETGYLML